MEKDIKKDEQENLSLDEMENVAGGFNKIDLEAIAKRVAESVEHRGPMIVKTDKPEE